MTNRATRVAALLYVEAPSPETTEAFQAAVAGQGGTVFAADTALGGLFAAPAAALAAARALGPALGTSCLAVHSGPVTRQGPGWGGPAAARARSLLAAAHPGQILVSQAAARAPLPPATSLQNLGERRLNDLLDREQVFQLCIPDLPDTFPPLRTLDAVPNNLSPQLYPLVGREAELAATTALLRRPDVRVLALIGAAGTGKTRLALQVAATLLPDFADGAWFVPLAPIRDPALVPAAIVSTLEIKESGGTSPVESLVEALRTRSLLLVLDNLEHLPAAIPPIVDLLAAIPGLRLLVTSRVHTNLPGESLFEVPTLALPDPQRLPPVDELGQVAAIALFMTVAHATDPDFALTAGNAPAIAAICTYLDGLPLAIELAAARVNKLPPAAMLARLHGSGGDAALPVLTGGAFYMPARQQTLRAAIGWSYELLDPADAQLFSRLAVFAGGCTLEAAAAVCGDFGFWILDFGLGGDAPDAAPSSSPASDSLITAPDTLIPDTANPKSKIQNPKSPLAATPATLIPDTPNPKSKIQNPKSDLATGLASLVDKSLLRAITPDDGPPRYRMLATIREYALELLEDRGELAQWRGRHAAWCLALAEAAAAEWVGPSAPAWGRRFEPEQDNFRAALAWSQGASAPPDLGLRLAIALAPFWNLRGYLSEGRQWLIGCLAARPQAPLALRLQAVHALGQVCWVQGDVAAAEARFAESLTLAREFGDPASIALALNRLGNVAFMRGDYDAAQPLWEESMDLRRALGDRAPIASSLNNLGILALAQGEFSWATALLGESLAILRELGDLGGQALAVGNLASIALQQGDYVGARPLYEECMALRRQLGDHSGIAGSLSDLGELARMEGDLARAETLLTEMLAVARAIGSQIMEARALAGLGRVALEQGAYLRAGALFREALGWFGRRTVKPQIAVCLIGLAGVAAGRGAPERAARLAGAAAALRAAIADRLPIGQTAIDAATLAPARAALSAAAWAAAEAAGAALPLDAAIALALEG